MGLIAYSKGTTLRKKTPERRAYDAVLDLRDERGELIRSSSSPRGSTYWKRVRRCPREHALYHAGLRRDLPESEHLAIGLMFHRALEHYYRALAAAPQDGVSAEQQAWESIAAFSGEEGYGDTWKQIEAMLSGYFELYRDVDRAWKIWAVEETIQYLADGMEWTGRLDGLIERDGALWILEHKTAKSITEELLSGYQMDMQMLGYVWLFKNVIDASQLPPFAGIIVNLATKHKAPKFERVEVCPSRYHLESFERSMRDWIQIRDQAFEPKGWPRALGNCTGPTRYFSTCDYFDLCHGRPEVSIAQLLREEPAAGFIRVDIDALDLDEVA